LPEQLLLSALGSSPALAMARAAGLAHRPMRAAFEAAGIAAAFFSMPSEVSACSGSPNAGGGSEMGFGEDSECRA